jgi:hypothetical protein
MNNQILLLGKTSTGKIFRPSDWAERLCGVLSCFDHPKLNQQKDAHLSFSFYASPVVVNQIKCVALHPDLKIISPEAFEFFLKFAQDNDLEMVDVCLLEDSSTSTKTGM